MKESKIAKEENAFKTALLLLPSRLFLFLAFQLLLAWLLGSFAESQKYWLLTASATNLVSITILVWLLKSERKRFFPLFHFDRKTLKRDIFTFLGITLLCGPVVFGPEYFLSRWIWSDPSIPFNMMFQPISRSLIYVLAVVFPVTIALAELSTTLFSSCPG